MTRKFQIDKYTSRLTDNNILDFTRNYLAAFHLNSFRQFEGKTKLSCEIWLKNEGLPIRESLFELYFWFGQERGIEKKIEDLNVLRSHICSGKEEIYYKERKEERLSRFCIINGKICLFTCLVT